MATSRRVLLWSRAIVFVFSLGVLSGCAQEIALPDDADEELVTGAAVFRERCARCHATDGGGGIGKSLRGIADRSSEAELRQVISEGKGTMPRFDSVLSDSDIDAVVRYSREILSGPPTG